MERDEYILPEDPMQKFEHIFECLGFKVKMNERWFEYQIGETHYSITSEFRIYYNIYGVHDKKWRAELLILENSYMRFSAYMPGQIEQMLYAIARIFNVPVDPELFYAKKENTPPIEITPIKHKS